MTFLTAREIAEAGIRLKLKTLPLTERGIQLHVRGTGWNELPVHLARKREGREGGGGMEYHISLLPEMLQNALHAEISRDVVLASQQQARAREIAKREAISTASLTARQRNVMTARSAILSAIETYQTSNGLSQRQAIQMFLADPAALHLSETILIRANDRAEKASVSRATIYSWFKLRESGIAALAPLPTKEKQDIPSWFWQFLRLYAQPRKPCLTEALETYCSGLPANVMRPNYDQVRRLMARLGNVEKHRGREGPLTLKARMAYTMRSTADLLPGCVYTSDGKTFDAEIAHPIHGQPFRPEVTPVVDVATRRCVGVSIGLSENSGGVVDALRHACETNGICAIFYADRGPGFRNDILDNQLTGLTERLGITKLHSLPYNSQARGIMERFHQTVWTPLAKTFETYIGEDMDREAKHRAFKETRRDLKQFGTSSKLPTFQQFITACNNAIAAYNARPHSALPDNMSPDQYWEYHVSTGFEIVPVLEGESDDLFRPYVRRKTSRAMVEFLTNSYFHLALEEFHDEYVLVGYDVHNASKVWVREIDRSSGDEQMGRLICVAVFAGNEERYIPLTMERAAMEKRATARARRLQDKLDVVAAELSPGRFLEGAGMETMPIILDGMVNPVEPVIAAIAAPLSAPDAVEPPRRLTFATDEDLAAWAIENPEKLTSNQVRVLLRCLQRPAATELFRLSGIDLDALRNVIRTADLTASNEERKIA